MLHGSVGRRLSPAAGILPTNGQQWPHTAAPDNANGKTAPMSFSDAIIEVIGAHECPLYRVGDALRIENTAIIPPPFKSTCIILAGDILEVIIRYGVIESDRKYRFDCSECTGFIKLEYRRQPPRPARAPDQDLDPVVDILAKFSLFQSLGHDNVRELVSFLHLKRYEPGDIIIRKGDPGQNLFIIVSGRVEVIGKEEISIATLGKGEIFGEMSLLSGDPVGATIRVLTPTKVLYLNGEDFKGVLQRFPSLQMYLACLLARRLAKTNVMMFEELSSGMIGKLSEMPPAGLFQMCNLNQKTGLLILELSRGNAEVAFRDGELVRAEYHGLEGKLAVYDILKEREGRFKLVPELCAEDQQAPVLGEFMKLLMEGVRQIDEARNPEVS